MPKVKKTQEDKPIVQENPQTVAEVPQESGIVFETYEGGLAGELAGQQPPINQGVIEAERLDAEEASQAHAQPMQAIPPQTSTQAAPISKKPVFDPAVHDVGPDGQPILTPTGRFKKKMGIPRKVNVAASKTPQITGGDMLALGRQQNESAAKLFTTMKTAILTSTISKEWELSKEEAAAEISALTESLNRYSPMGVAVNPLILYAGVVAINAGKRFNQPETQTFTQKVKARLAGWWINRKGKKQNASQPNSGSNNVGENNASNSTGK